LLRWRQFEVREDGGKWKSWMFIACGDGVLGIYKNRFMIHCDE
jgi:hypothetical protein